MVNVASGLVGRCRADAHMDESADFCGLQRIPADFLCDVSRGGIVCWSRARGALACVLDPAELWCDWWCTRGFGPWPDVDWGPIINVRVRHSQRQTHRGTITQPSVRAFGPRAGHR